MQTPNRAGIFEMRRLVDVFEICSPGLKKKLFCVNIYIYSHLETFLADIKRIGSGNNDGQDCLRIRSGPGFPLSATVLIG